MSQPDPGATATIATATSATATSATAAAPASVAAFDLPRRRVWPDGRLLRSELRLIFGRRRNWAGMLVLAAVPTLIAIAVKLWAAPSGGGGGGGNGPDFASQITNNGIFVALTALTLELPLFLPLAVAAIASDAIAGEANSGTLRYLLTVPVHRTRLLVVKYTAIVIFGIVATLVVAVVGAVMGLALFGGGNMTLLSGAQVSFADGLWRLLLICGYIMVCLAGLGAVGLFVSTLTEQPIGGTIAILILCVGSEILDSISQLSTIHPYLLTHYWLAFGDLLRDPIVTQQIGKGLVLTAVYIVVFATAAWARFASKDISG